MTVVIVIAIIAVALIASLTFVRTRHRGPRPPVESVEEAKSTTLTGPAPDESLSSTTLEPAVAPVVADDAPTVESAPTEQLTPASLRDRLGKTRALFSASFGRLSAQGKIDESAFEDLEEALILADVGLNTTNRLLSPLRDKLRDGVIEATPEQLASALQQQIVDLFANEDRSLHLGERSPAVWMFVGVNGVGKTTTIGKVASTEMSSGKKVVIAAADTFRAAAGEQLSTWAERSGAGIIRGADGADPSSVVFDAVSHAAARNADLVLVDSAGRLHTKVNLMEELKKMRRVADRPPGEVTEVLLVLDATTGQNGLAQAREFAEAVSLTGVVLTKLDGSAKGGVVLAIRSELGVPIKLVGVGEQIQDLVVFDPKEFAAALLS